MKFDPETKILTMSQTDLEHCGFSWEEFAGELFLSGFSESVQQAALDSRVIVVMMHRGKTGVCEA